jgi:hypothetical protein
LGGAGGALGGVKVEGEVRAHIVLSMGVHFRKLITITLSLG